MEPPIGAPDARCSMIVSSHKAGILARQVGADEAPVVAEAAGLKAWLQWLGNHPGGEQRAEFDSEFLRAGDPSAWSASVVSL
jgi:hypothetical protein